MATPRETTINLRAHVARKALIDRAADAIGQNRSQFMIDAAVQRAESVLADRTRFELSAEQMSKFRKALDAPLPDRDALRRLLTRSAPWER
jgi:uncharacterized protein (DUF1778 family)